MNYRHAFHAGNFADVFKHALLCRVLFYLMQKDAPLRYLDTHAGAGLYDIAGEAANRTGEWKEGVGLVEEQHGLAAFGGGTLRFRLPATQRVELTLFDTAGRRVAKLADGTLPAGDHAIRWDRLDVRGGRVAPGVYRARLKAGAETRTLDVVLLD